MEPLLEIEQVTKIFSLGGKKKLEAVKDVSLNVFQAETLGIVGESGCGKSTLARIIMGIYPPTEGEVRYRGQRIDSRSHRARLAYSENVQMIFQDTYTSLDPRMTVEAIIAENLEIHKRLTGKGRKQRVCELLNLVGLPQEAASRYPHEFSGGQRQRIGIARALSIEPEFLICDEPISALDMSIQSQVMNLLKSLKDRLNLTYLFIAHDLNMVRYISDRIAVLYRGRVVELAEADALYSAPAHPYTKMLMGAVLTPDPNENKLEREKMKIQENVQIEGADGCPFWDRCGMAEERCKCSSPVLREVEKGHFAACHILNGMNGDPEARNIL